MILKKNIKEILIVVPTLHYGYVHISSGDTHTYTNPLHRGYTYTNTLKILISTLKENNAEYSKFNMGHTNIAKI